MALAFGAASCVMQCAAETFGVAYSASTHAHNLDAPTSER